MSTTSDKTDKKISPMGDIGDNDGMYEFLNKYFKEFNPIG